MRLGICEQILIIYDSVVKISDPLLQEEIMEKLIDLMIMAKKMDIRLVYYYKTYHDTTGHGGKNILNISGNRARWKMRRSR
jgi:hypothetical protein